MASAQKGLFENIKPWLDEEQCRTCECLQLALIQIEMDDEENMSVVVAPHKIFHEQMHPCLGCEPCPPAQALVDYVQSLRNMSS